MNSRRNRVADALADAVLLSGLLLSAPLLPVLLAPLIGSFLGVVILRLPAGRPVVLGRSACDSCGRALQAIDMVPLVSFLLLRGRCRHCGARIGLFHPLIEAMAVAVAAWAWTVEADPAALWADCLLGWTLLALAWIDWRHMRLPDVLTLPLVVVGLLVTWAQQPDDLLSHALGAAAGYLGLRAISLGYRLVRKREGLGAGDAKLMAAAGAWVGLAPLPLIILGGAVSGLAIVLGGAIASRSVSRLRATTAIAFGPCLALPIWLVRLYGPSLS